MKLPPDYRIASLGDLRRVVSLLGAGNHVAHDEELEMAEDQYNRYKELVFKADTLRFYQGMKIRLTTQNP